MRSRRIRLMAAIRLRAGQLGDWYRSHRRRPQPAPDSDDSTSQTPADASANATAPDSDAPARSEDSADTVTVEERGTQGQRWATLARQQKLPRFIRRYAQRHWMAKEAKAIERLAGRRDADENRDTPTPDSEQVRIAVIWLTELYTSTTLAGLLNGLPPLIAKADDPNPERGDFADWVQAARRQGGGSYRMLPEVLPPGSPHLSTQIIDFLPAGITSVTLGIYTLTSTVTAVTAAFHVQEDHAQELQRIINQDVSTKAIPRANGGYSISGVRSQKEQAADGWRESLRTETANWLAARLPDPSTNSGPASHQSSNYSSPTSKGPGKSRQIQEAYAAGHSSSTLKTWNPTGSATACPGSGSANATSTAGTPANRTCSSLPH